MFNRTLNDKSTEKLKQFCEGKRVLLVGNAASLFMHEYGSLIDEYDVVVRFGKGIPHEKYRAHLGSKTDVWFFGTLRASMFEHWKNARFKLFNYTQVHLYNPSKAPLTFPYCMATDEFQIYKDYFVLGNADDHKRLITTVYGPLDKKNWRNAPRMSQGTLAFLYFADVIKTQGSLDLIGFDFFQSTLNYEYEGKDKKIYSWHVPVPIDSHEANPHGGDIERDYILSRIASDDNMNIYNMNHKISKEVSKKLITENRPGAKPK